MIGYVEQEDGDKLQDNVILKRENVILKKEDDIGNGDDESNYKIRR